MSGAPRTVEKHREELMPRLDISENASLTPSGYVANGTGDASVN
jgi:hypothetical protein